MRHRAGARGRGAQAWPERGGEPAPYKVGNKMATRKAYGEALAAIGPAPRSSSSTPRWGTRPRRRSSTRRSRAATSRCSSPSSSSSRGRRPGGPRVRAVCVHVRRLLHPGLRLVRMAAISRAKIRLSGSHAGVEIGADGPSQMALEDLAMMRAVHGSTVLYPLRRRRARRNWSGMSDPTASSTCAPPAGSTRCCTGRPRSSRSAARGVPVQRRMTRSRIGAGVTLHNAWRPPTS